MRLLRPALILQLSLISLLALAQTDFERGLALERAFKDQEALIVYEQIIKLNPNHADALAQASRMHANIGGRLAKAQREQKIVHIEKAQTYAERALKLDSKHAKAHLSFVISLGLMSEVSSSPSEKVKNAKLIYQEGQTLLRLDSTSAVAHFILGKWHYELGRLNWMERTACELFFGGMPENVSLEKALEYLQKASRLEPNTILFLYNEALVYHELDHDKKAIELLRKALSLPNQEPDDTIRKEKCSALLRELED